MKTLSFPLYDTEIEHTNFLKLHPTVIQTGTDD